MTLHVIMGALLGLLTAVATGYFWKNRRALYWASVAIFLLVVWLYEGTVGNPAGNQEVTALMLAFFAVNLTTAALLRNRAPTSRSEPSVTSASQNAPHGRADT